MRKFHYKVIDNMSRSRQGELEGETMEKIADTLLSQGYTILELRPIGFNWNSLKSINIGGIPFGEKVIFMRQMSFMINAGLPITQALAISRDQIANLKFKDLVAEILKDVEGGAPLSRSLERHPDVFDPVVKNLIKAGEESGKLDLILLRIADDLEKQQEFNGKVKGALIYPIVILVAIAAVVVLLLIYMVPEMSKLYEGQNAQLPLPTQIILNMSNFLTQGFGGVIVGVLTLTAIGGFIYYRRTPSGRLVTDKLYLKAPIFGDLIRKSQVASFARTFSMLLSAGVPILDALKLVSDSTTNTVFQIELQDARKKVEKGVPLSAPIINSAQAFPQLMGHMMKVGEETGKLDEVVAKVGEQYAREVDQMASNLSKLMEPVILIVMGLVVGVLALAVYLPIFNLGSTLTGS